MRGMGPGQNSNCLLLASEIEERAFNEAIRTRREVGKGEKSRFSPRASRKTCRNSNFDQQDPFHSSEPQKGKKINLGCFSH